MEKILNHICGMIKEFWNRSYGDPTDSKCVLINITGSDWQPIISASKRSIFIIRNKDTSNELEYTWNEKDEVGIQLKKDSSDLLDSVSGTLFARPVTSTNTISINVGVIAQRTYVS